MWNDVGDLTWAGGRKQLAHVRGWGRDVGGWGGTKVTAHAHVPHEGDRPRRETTHGPVFSWFRKHALRALPCMHIHTICTLMQQILTIRTYVNSTGPYFKSCNDLQHGRCDRSRQSLFELSGFLSECEYGS